MRLAEAKARRTVVLRNSSFNLRMLKAQWLQWESSYPTSWSQSGNESGHGGCSLFTERLPALRGNGHGNGRDITPVSMVTIHYPVCAAGNSEHTVQVVRSIWAGLLHKHSHLKHTNVLYRVFALPWACETVRRPSLIPLKRSHMMAL